MVEVTKTDGSTLSRRQRECLQGVADHLDSQQIAERLGISPHTVDGHVAAAVKALRARSRRDAVRVAGLLPDAGQSITGQFPPVDSASEIASPSSLPQGVREAPIPFVVQPMWREASHEEPAPKPYLTLLAILGGAVAVVILLLALDPLARSAANLANAIQLLHRK